MKKTGTPGVYIREGIKDTSYYIRYRKNGKVVDEKVGTKSDGTTIIKAKKILLKRQLNPNKEENIKYSLAKKSLNELANMYFDKFELLAEREVNLEKEDKQYKDKLGIDREKSLYKTFWQNWELSILEFNKLQQSHFVNRINEIREFTYKKNKNSKAKDIRYSNKYILNAITLIKSIINHTNVDYNPLYIHSKKSVKEEQDLKDIYKDLKKKIEPRTSYLEPEEIKLLLETLKNNSKHYQGYLICLIMATTGMRPDSVLNLKINDFDIRNKIINVYDFKRKMYYKSNLTKRVEDEILFFGRDRDINNYLFFSEYTNGISKLPNPPKYINNTIDELFNKNKFNNDRNVLYTLRHSFATNLVKGLKGIDGKYIIEPVSIFKVQQLLNHANIETTINHYLKFSPDFVVDSISALENSIL
ncbi:site-specific tyrosine recombinase XerC [Aliarcobacter thereius]|uniref:Site-specific tyrosine recombinase XerC n=1 Tax=Aliarcobacter thereius TaxID=544718 RepID=A0A1C0B7J2_9BACT|nr:site-specific integrase [Aliarcobacter thereius]OCL99560.1 site-specific tyrosine recombinase XerC [Aliarcobacter thereius]